MPRSYAETNQRMARIARKNERIRIQRNEVSVDAYGNHLNTWIDVFSCAAYASTYQYDEEKASTVTTEERTITFEVRYCPELSGLNAIHYRVIFHGDVYNILSVDMMNYQRKSICIKCSLQKRKDGR